MEWVIGGVAVVAVVGVIALAVWLVFKILFKDTSSHLEPESGYSIWCYKGGKWVLQEDHSKPGYVPGQPPTEPGPHEDYCVKVDSVPAPTR